MKRTLLELFLILAVGAAVLEAAGSADRTGSKDSADGPAVLEEVERLAKEVRPLGIPAER